MIESPYRSTACSSYILDKIVSSIRTNFLRPNGSDMLLQWSGVGIVTHAMTEVKEFSQPLAATELAGHSSQAGGIFLPEVILDGRPWLRARRNQETRKYDYEIATHGDGMFEILRAQLQVLWQKPDTEFNKVDMMNVGDLPPTVFTRWITGTLTQKLGLDEVQAHMTMLVCAYYYYSLFYKESEFTQVVKAKTVRQAAQITRHPFDVATRLLEEVQYLDKVGDLIKALKIVVNSVRLENLNTGLLWSMLGNGWYGVNKVETIAVALEHPPTWLSMIYFSANDRSYKKSPIGTITLNNVRSQNDRTLTRSIKVLVRAVGDSPIFQED